MLNRLGQKIAILLANPQVEPCGYGDAVAGVRLRKWGGKSQKEFQHEGADDEKK